MINQFYCSWQFDYLGLGEQLFIFYLSSKNKSKLEIANHSVKDRSHIRCGCYEFTVQITSLLRFLHPSMTIWTRTEI